MEVQSIERIYKSWDHIKSLPNYQEEFGVSLFSRIHALSKRVGALFYKDGKADRNHAKLFSQMIDLIIHMLGPDMDPVLEQLEELGERHADSYGVSSKQYPIFGEALLNTLELLLDRQWKPAVRDAWLDLWRIMSMTMLRGARKVVRRRKKEKQRLEQQRQQQQQRLSSECEGPADLTESSCSSLTSMSLTDSPSRSSPTAASPKPRNMRTIMLAPGHGSSTAYLNLSDEEGLDIPISDEKSSKKKNKKKKSKKCKDVLLLDEESSDHEPSKPSSLNNILCIDDDDDDDASSAKPSSFTSLGGRTKRKGSRKPRPGMTRAESCHIVANNSSEELTTTESKKPSSPRKGMVRRVASFRLRKRATIMD